MLDLRGALASCLMIGLAVASLALSGGLPAVAADDMRLVVGRISEKPRDHYGRLRALADYLAEELADDGVVGVDVVLVDSLERMRQMMAAGQVDIASETAFMALALEEAGVADLLLREWKQGVGEYHSVFFARRDSGIMALSDLPGHIIAFEDPGSTSAYLIPRFTLERNGIALQPQEGLDGELPASSAAYVFAEGEVNVVAWVHRGLADVGVVSNLDWANDEETPPFMRDDLMIIHETAPIIRSLLLVRSTLAPEFKARLSTLFLGLHESEAGRRVLERYFSVSRYDRISDGSLVGLEMVREIRQSLER